jgi:hypothetical protein
MPIVWKVTFEEPLIRLIQSGQISNSKKLVDAIALQYDLSIRQGLPNPPGTPAGPLINGNILAFKKALNTFYKLEAIKQQALVIALYARTAKGILQTIKSTYQDIAVQRNQLRALSKQQATNIRKIKQLKRVKSLDSARQIAKISSENSKLTILRTQIVAFIQSKKDEIIEVIRPKIKALKDELKAFVKKILLPMLQTSQLKIIKSIPRVIKNAVTEIKDKKKQYLGVIKNNVQTVNNISKTFKALRGSLKKEDATKIKTAMNVLVKSSNISTLIKNGELINSTLSKYGDTAINPSLKASCRSGVIKIIKLKSEINTLKEEAKSSLVSKLQERKDDILKSFKPKFGPGQSRIQELRQRAKELKSFVTEYKNMAKRVSTTAKTYSKVKTEYSKVRKLKDSDKVVPNTAVSTALDTYSPGKGSKYLEIKSSKQAKAFLYSTLIELASSNQQLNELKSKYRDNISDIKNKILSQRLNPKELIFNSFLRLAVTGYWTGGVMPNLGIVTFPGVVTLPVPLKATSNPANFIRGLSKTFQLHTKTVAGTYTIPGTPPVILPWVGYN